MTRVVGICRCKDEADIIETTVRHMLTQVDAVLVADNGSTDGTLEILRSLGPNVAVQVDPEVGYYQSVQMSALASDAWFRFEPDWIVPFDADELWYAREPEWGTVAQVLASLPEIESIARADLYDYVASGYDGSYTNPVARIQWRQQEPALLPKVAVRPLMHVTIEQGNHGANYGQPSPSTVLKVRHFPYRSPEQMIRKVRNGAAAYRATDLDERFGAHWRGYDAFTDEEIAGIFRKWFYREKPDRPAVVDDGVRLEPLVHDPVLVDGRPL